MVRPVRWRRGGGSGSICAGGRAELYCTAIVPLDGFGDIKSFTLCAWFRLVYRLGNADGRRADGQGGRKGRLDEETSEVEGTAGKFKAYQCRAREGQVRWRHLLVCVVPQLHAPWTNLLLARLFFAPRALAAMPLPPG